MVDAVNHDKGSELATAGWEAGKGALIGLAAITLASAAVGAIALGSIATATLGGGAMGAALIGAIAGGAIGGTLGSGASLTLAAIGGVIGLGRAGKRITREKEAFNNRVEALSHARENKVAQRENAAEMKAMQDVYPVAFNDGRSIGQREGAMHVMKVLQEQAERQQGAAASNSKGAAALAMATAEARCECGPHTKNVIEREKASAVAAAAGQSPTV